MSNNIEEIQKILESNKHGWEILQWSVMNALGSLVYTEFISNMKKMDKPIPHVKIPTIKTVREIVSHNSPLIKEFSMNILSQFQHHQHRHYWDNKEFEIFANADEFHSVLVAYVLPNIERYIPEVISRKFGLETDQQMFREDISIDLFHRDCTQPYIVSYLLQETVLQFIKFAGVGISHKLASANDDKVFVNLGYYDIYSISNINAIAPILLDVSLIIRNEKIRDLISKITKTTFEFDINQEVGNLVIHIETSKQNEIEVITLEDPQDEDY